LELKGTKDKGDIEEPINIPYELMQFVQRYTYSLLIKGYAGTGKTTLSLTILRALNIKSNFFYISTGTSTKQLFLYYPWLGKLIEQPKELKSEEVLANEYNVSSFEDARLDEPESLFERITNQLMDVKAPIIIIDSWDAIASFMDKEARVNNERVLQTWRERAGAKLIFICEDPTDKTLDFLVDGIVELEQTFYDNVRIRKITLSKLRGVQINKQSYIYTLNNGIFRSYDPYRPTEFKITSDLTVSYNNRTEPMVTSVSEDLYVTSGYQGLDTALGGGFPKKGIVLLEIDPNVNKMVAITFLSRIMANFARTSNPILFHPFDGIDPSIIITYIKPHLSSYPRKELIKIFWPANKVVGASDYMIYNERWDDFEKQIEFFHNVIIKTKEQYPEKLILNIMGIDMFQKTHNHGQINRMDVISLIRANPDLSIVIIRNSQNVGDYLSEISDVHLRLRIINDTLFLQSLCPPTYLYAITTTRSSGLPEIKLEPIV
jgi:KaiC/GvpD/RAD55 family RecA-like ATPase